MPDSNSPQGLGPSVIYDQIWKDHNYMSKTLMFFPLDMKCSPQSFLCTFITEFMFYSCKNFISVEEKHSLQERYLAH